MNLFLAYAGYFVKGKKSTIIGVLIDERTALMQFQEPLYTNFTFSAFSATTAINHIFRFTIPCVHKTVQGGDHPEIQRNGVVREQAAVISRIKRGCGDRIPFLLLL